MDVKKEHNQFRIALNKVNQLLKRVHPKSFYVMRGEELLTYNKVSTCIGKIAKDNTRERLEELIKYTEKNPIVIVGDDLYDFFKNYKKSITDVIIGKKDVQRDNNDESDAVTFKIKAINEETSNIVEVTAVGLGDGNILNRYNALNKMLGHQFFEEKMDLDIKRLLLKNTKKIKIKIGDYKAIMTKSAIPCLTSKSKVNKYGYTVDDKKFITRFKLFRKACNLNYYYLCYKLK